MDFIRLPQLCRPGKAVKARENALLSDEGRIYQSSYKIRLEHREDGPVKAIAFCPRERDDVSGSKNNSSELDGGDSNGDRVREMLLKNREKEDDEEVGDSDLKESGKTQNQKEGTSTSNANISNSNANSANFNNNSNYLNGQSSNIIALGYNTKISLWSTRSKQSPVAVVNKFKDYTTCLNFRNDGKLLIAGEAGGSLAVFDSAGAVSGALGANSNSTNVSANFSVLRRMKGHTDAVQCCAFSMNKTQILSGGRDRSVRLFDIGVSSGSNNILTWSNAHKDYVKCLDASPVSNDIWITGSADGGVCIWDSRIQMNKKKGTNINNESNSNLLSNGGNSNSNGNGCLYAQQVHLNSNTNSSSNLNYSDPVEQIKWLSGGSMFATCGGTAVRMWDVRNMSNNNCVLSFGNSHHTKDIMDFSLGYSPRFGGFDGDDTNGSGGELRVLTASLDRSARIWDAKTGEHLSSFNTFESGVTKCGWQGDSMLFALDDGNWCVRKKAPARNEASGNSTNSKKSKASCLSNAANIHRMQRYLGSQNQLTARYYKRGSTESAREGVDTIVSTKRVKLNAVEHHLKKFEYKLALDVGLLNSSGNLSYSLGLLDELSSRNAISQACAGRSEASCLQILHWIHQVVCLPEAATFRTLILEVFSNLVEQNSCLNAAESPAVVDLLSKIRSSVRQELALQDKNLRPLLGCVDTLLSQ